VLIGFECIAHGSHACQKSDMIDKMHDVSGPAMWGGGGAVPPHDTGEALGAGHRVSSVQCKECDNSEQELVGAPAMMIQCSCVLLDLCFKIHNLLLKLAHGVTAVLGSFQQPFWSLQGRTCGAFPIVDGV